MPYPRAQLSEGTRGARAASAQLDHAVDRRTRQPAPERRREAERVGVVPDAPAAREDHRVDGADVSRLRGQVVEQPDDLLLERMGDVDADEAGGLGAIEQRAETGLGVEQRVREVEAVRTPLGLVQRRRERGLDPRPDQAAPHHQHQRFLCTN
jgi:hypothetical protein